MSEIEELRKEINNLKSRLLSLETSRIAHRDCINIHADQLDRLNREVFGEEPEEEC